MDHSSKFRVAVVGAGLGGLVFARALLATRLPLDVVVYDRDADAHARGQGYLIGLNKDGLKALDRVMTSRLRAFLAAEAAHGVKGFVLTDQSLYTLLRIPDESMSAVNRGILREVLAGVASKDDQEEEDPFAPHVEWNRRLVRYEENDSIVRLFFEDGSEAEADLLIGADGVNSVVRAQRCPRGVTVQHLPVLNIAFNAPFPASPESIKADIAPALAASQKRLFDSLNCTMMRALGSGGRSVLAMPFLPPGSHERVCTWGLTMPISSPRTDVMLDMNASGDAVLAGCVNELIAGGFDEALVSLAKSSIPTAIGGLRTPRTSVFNGSNVYGESPSRVTLLGDAAHPMTTHAGLGANTAFVDAVALADAVAASLAPGGNWTSAVAVYEKELLARGKRNVRISHANTMRMVSTSVVGAFIARTIMRMVNAVFSFVRWIRGN